MAVEFSCIAIFQIQRKMHADCKLRVDFA